MTGLKHSYTQVDHWRQYQRFLPARARLDDATLPAEQWWPWRGGEIHLDRYTVPGAPLTVVMMHGAGGHARLMSPFAVMLRSLGYEVVLPDMPGYGLSVVPPELFHCDAWVDCAADLVAREAERSGRPVVVFGSSMTGYVAYQAAARSRRAAGVIVTTLCDPRQPLCRDQFARNKLLSRLLVPVMPGLSALLGDVRVPVRWLSRMSQITNDADLTRLLCADPIAAGNRTPLRFLDSILRMQPVIEPEQFDLCPLLLAHPADDRWTTVPASRLFFDRIKGPKELVLLENCGHYPIEEPGFSQLEAAARTFLNRLVA
jgi:alpha-beta hydrolase superfamily lysophospholipase